MKIAWQTWTEVAPMAYALFFVGIYYVNLLNKAPATHHLVGIALTFTGFLCWIISRAQLGQAFSVKPKATQLITHGFYARFRHPIYYFELLSFLGVAIFFWNIYVSASAFFLLSVQLYRMRVENELLRQTFGSEYEKYRSTVWF